MRIIHLCAAAALTLVSPAATGVGQASAATVPPDSRAVVEEVRRVIAERYVLPERRPALDAVLAEGLESGRYDVPEPGALAGRIDADLARVGRDRHLTFSYSPAQAALLASPPAGEEPDRSAWERQVRAGNHGVAELRLLPGNIRYMAYTGFAWIGEDSAAALETAMRFLAGGDAMIIDLRRNGGGSPHAVQYLVSHFMAPGRPLVTFHMNGAPTPDSLATLPDLPAGNMVGRPLYVLTSAGTASAAEEFTGHVLGYGLGEVVGENTAGAGFRNEAVAIGGRFVLSVSVGRAVLASTGRDWEGVGHAPTIAADVGDALEVAQAHALARVAAGKPEAERARLHGLADVIAARLEPRTPALPLGAYAGRYGERIVTLEDGRLHFRRGSRPPTALIPLGGHLFAFDVDPALQVAFEPGDDRAAALEMRPLGEPGSGRHARTE